MTEIILTAMILVTMFYCEGLNKRIKKLEDRINGLNRENISIFSHETIEYISKEEAIESHAEFMNPNVTRDSKEETDHDRAYAKGWNDAIKAYIKELKELPSKDKG